MRQSIHILLDLIKTFIVFLFLRHTEEDGHLTYAQFIGTAYLNLLNLSSILNYSKVAFVNFCVLLTNLFPFPLFYFLPLFVLSLSFLLFFRPTIVNMFDYYIN